jgi:hypothetical protein
MKLTSFKITAGALLGLLLIIGGRTLLMSGQPANPSSTPATGNFSKRSIHGVWLTVVQQKDCQTGNPGAGLGRGLMTFAEGGTLSGTLATVPGSSPPVSLGSSPGHGVWERHSWNHYTATMIAQRLNPDGTFAGWHKVEVSLQLAPSGNEFTGTSSFEIVNPSGAVLASGCSAITGTRLQ